MNDIPVKDNQVGMPVERHLTAAWADVGGHKPASNVSIPSMEGVVDAKDYVDENEK